MADESKKVNEFISEENLKKAKSAFSVEQVLNLTSLSTKSKLVTFWLSVFIPGGGYLYLNLYGKGYIVFLTCFVLFIFAIISFVNEVVEVGVLFLLLDFLVHFISMLTAIAKVDSVKNEAKYQLSEYYKQKNAEIKNQK